MAILARDYHFHPLDLDSCLSTIQLTKIEDHQDYFFIMLQIPDQGDHGIIGCKQVSMFLGKDYLVIIHSSSLKTISAMFQSCRDDEKERSALIKSSAYLAYRIIDNLSDGISAILDNVQTALNSIEAVVFNEKKSSARAINLARRQIADFEKDRLSAGYLYRRLEQGAKVQQGRPDDLLQRYPAQSWEDLREDRGDEGDRGDIQRHRLYHEQ